MTIKGKQAQHRWLKVVIWYDTFLIYLETYYETKKTYQSAINSFNTIFSLLDIPSPFRRRKQYPRFQVDIFMARAFMASYKAASTCRGAKSAAEDA